MSRVEASNAISYKGTVSVEIVTNGNKSNKVIKNTGTDDLFYLLCAFLGGKAKMIETGLPQYLDIVWVDKVTTAETKYLTHRLPFIGSPVLANSEEGEPPFVEFEFNINNTDKSPYYPNENEQIPQLRLYDNRNTMLASINGDHELELLLTSLGPGSNAIVKWRMQFLSYS